MTSSFALIYPQRGESQAFVRAKCGYTHFFSWLWRYRSPSSIFHLLSLRNSFLSLIRFSFSPPFRLPSVPSLPFLPLRLHFSLIVPHLSLHTCQPSPPSHLLYSPYSSPLLVPFSTFLVSPCLLLFSSLLFHLHFPLTSSFPPSSSRHLPSLSSPFTLHSFFSLFHLPPLYYRSVPHPLPGLRERLVPLCWVVFWFCLSHLLASILRITPPTF